MMRPSQELSPSGRQGFVVMLLPPAQNCEKSDNEIRMFCGEEEPSKPRDTEYSRVVQVYCHGMRFEVVKNSVDACRTF